jgi:hypothetical protein
MSRSEALRAAVRSDDEAAVIDLLSDLSEADRAELSPVVRDLVADVKRKGIDAVGHLGPTLVAAYGVLPASDLRTLGWRSNHLPKQLVDVLRRRSPERLVPIVRHLLDDVGGGRAWRTVRPLVRDGVVPRPDDASYTLAMLAGTAYRNAAELVADDSGLLEVEVWRLFEVEGGGETSLANHEKFFGDPWGTVLRELAAGEPAFRRRVLAASLAALARDFATYRAGWFSRFHESLAPTDDERTERADAYLALLRSRVGPTVSFAVAALRSIQHGGRLPADLLFDRIAPVLADAPAGTAIAALDLLRRAASGSPEAARRAAVVAVDALAHPSPEVQGRALGLVGRLIDQPDEAVARALAARLPHVAASQRSAATALLARLGDGERGAGPTSPPADESAPVAAPLAVSTRNVSSDSPTGADRAIRTLATLEDLVDAAVSVIESGEPADDVERVLDAVGRLAADRPPVFPRLTASIAKRARTILARRDSSPFSGVNPRADVAGVLLAWTTGELVAPDPIHPSAEPGAGLFLSARAREVAEAAGARRPFVGVAAPTHSGGWIDPAELVQRIASRPPASRLDLVAALLRLAPDGREAALPASADLGGEIGAIVRYALGGQESIGPTAPWWVAAARVRAPGEDDELVERRHPRLGPEAGRAARIRLRVRDPRPYAGGFGLDIEPPLPGDRRVELPTVLMLRDPSSFAWTGRSEPAMIRWMATIQPGSREVWAAVGSVPIARNVDWWSAEWANRAFLEPFVDRVAPIGPHARALVGIALGAREAGERGLATDITRLALADGRLTAPTLAEGLTAAAAISCDRPNRWALSLSDVAATSADHAAAVADAIILSLPAVAGRPPAKLVPLLRVLDELLAGLGVPPAADGRPALAVLAAFAGQAGRLARSILARG